MNSGKREILDRISLYEKIKNSDDKESFLTNCYNLFENSHEFMRSFEGSKKILFYGLYTEKLCQQIKDKNLECLIAGSSGLACLYSKCNFVPNDIDIYVKNINKEKVVALDNIIRNIIGDKYIILLVRNQITLTWLVFNEIDKNSNGAQVVRCKIQLNLLNIESWSELFSTYHSNIICCGYDILDDSFVCLNDRWKKLFTNDVHYFTNILNVDNASTLDHAIKKYTNRGFECDSIHVINKNKIDISVSDSSGMYDCEGEFKNYMDYLNFVYRDSYNVRFSYNCEHLYTESITISIMDLWKLTDQFEIKNNKEIYYFLGIPRSLDKYDDVFCLQNKGASPKGKVLKIMKNIMKDKDIREKKYPLHTKHYDNKNISKSSEKNEDNDEHEHDDKDEDGCEDECEEWEQKELKKEKPDKVTKKSR
jgi:hypothetical protein